ncbi:hypothetical protein [Victivallis sp. Marseille-Q1083]|uniref:hypothetical protein n=1 Tax=Victivallis sp. Marseille-Q1083 TaxID=2717288 RepID=UPI001588F5A4|nr:hypothetical protein [Victivallis sp. Marseille-Q1083]
MKYGVWQHLVEALQQENVIRIKMEAVCLTDKHQSASKWNRSFKKSGKQGIGYS